MDWKGAYLGAAMAFDQSDETGKLELRKAVESLGEYRIQRLISLFRRKYWCCAAVTVTKWQRDAEENEVNVSVFEEKPGPQDYIDTLVQLAASLTGMVRPLLVSIKPLWIV